MVDVRGFVEAVRHEYGMRPVVPFEHPIAIGDIGKIGRDGTWQPISTARHRFDCAPEGVRKTKDGRGTWSASSGKDVTFKAYARGQTSKLVSNVADAKARAEIEFAKSKGFVFAAKGVTIQSATEMDGLIEAIRWAYHNRRDLPEDKRWDKDLAFVFAVGDAARFTALIAESSNTSVVMTGRGKVGPPAAAADLAAGVTIGISDRELMQVNQVRAVGRLYRAYRLDPGILTRWKNEPVREAYKRMLMNAQSDGGGGASAGTFDEVFKEV